MRKFLIILSVLLVFSLVGCSTAENTSSDVEINSSSVIETSSEEASSTDESSADSETYSDEIVSTETSSEVSSAEMPKEESKPTTNTQSSSTTSSTNNTESKVENSSTPTQNQATHKDRIDITNQNEYIKHTWSEDPNTGEKIEGSDQYVDRYGNVYDCQGYYLYNLSEWGVHYYTYEK